MRNRDEQNKKQYQQETCSEREMWGDGETVNEKVTRGMETWIEGQSQETKGEGDTPRSEEKKMKKKNLDKPGVEIQFIWGTWGWDTVYMGKHEVREEHREW